jgi:hypothetical protein
VNVAFHYGIDARGRTADVGDDAHVRDLIEQVRSPRRASA